MNEPKLKSGMFLFVDFKSLGPGFGGDRRDDSNQEEGILRDY